MHADNPVRVHVHEIKNLVGHGVEARPWLDIVIVVVGDEDARGVHGKCPEAVEVDLLAHLHGGSHQHQATAQPLGTHTLYRPETLHVEQVLRVEEENAPLRVKVVQHVLDPERHVGVAGVVECWEHHRSVLIVLEHLVKRATPLLQLLEPEQGQKKPKGEAD